MLTTGPRRSLTAMRPDQLERRLRARIDASGPAPRAEATPRPHAARLRASRPDRRVLGEPEDADVRRAADRLRGRSDAAGGGGRCCLRACLPSLTYLSYRSRLMYRPDTWVTIQIAIRTPTAPPAPLAGQEGVILLGPQPVWGQQARCPGSPIQGPGATSGTHRASRTLGGRVAYCLRTASYKPSRLDWEKG